MMGKKDKNTSNHEKTYGYQTPELDRGIKELNVGIMAMSTISVILAAFSFFLLYTAYPEAISAFLQSLCESFKLLITS